VGLPLVHRDTLLRLVKRVSTLHVVRLISMPTVDCSVVDQLALSNKQLRVLDLSGCKRVISLDVRRAHLPALTELHFSNTQVSNRTFSADRMPSVRVLAARHWTSIDLDAIAYLFPSLTSLALAPCVGRLSPLPARCQQDMRALVMCVRLGSPVGLAAGLDGVLEIDVPLAPSELPTEHLRPIQLSAQRLCLRAADALRAAGQDAQAAAAERGTLQLSLLPLGSVSDTVTVAMTQSVWVVVGTTGA
jgi:hypothetical protein